MDKEELIAMLEAKINSLVTLKGSLERLNELQQAQEVEIEINQTKALLNEQLSPPSE
jgi:hypothetical protein